MRCCAGTARAARSRGSWCCGGAVSVAMITVDSVRQFHALRFLLGVFEAGFFPGLVFYLICWYPARRRASVLSIFYAGFTNRARQPHATRKKRIAVSRTSTPIVSTLMRAFKVR